MAKSERRSSKRESGMSRRERGWNTRKRGSVRHDCTAFHLMFWKDFAIVYNKAD